MKNKESFVGKDTFITCSKVTHLHSDFSNRDVTSYS